MTFKSNVLLLFTVLFFSLASVFSQNVKEERLAMRLLGHRVLLAFGDSSSRVLPVIEESDAYRVQFEGDFGFQPEELVEVVRSAVRESEVTRSFLVEVADCKNQEIVYSFKVEEEKQSNIIPCRGREMPKSCYYLLFTSLENPKEAVISSKSDKEATKSEEKGAAAYLLMLAAVILVLIAYFLWKRKRVSKIDPMILRLGKYHFDTRKEELILEEQRIELTSKEADLLKLLYNTANNTVERDHILNQVWGDEGDYVGRTLDVFISKLRKKLEFDSEIKIVNVRGVGYKLVL